MDEENFPNPLPDLGGPYRMKMFQAGGPLGQTLYYNWNSSPRKRGIFMGPETYDRALTDTVYVALDVETTGLHPFGGDRLLQIALALYTSDLYPLTPCETFTISYPPDEVQEMKDWADPYVQEMHTKNGLWQTVAEDLGCFDIDDVEDYLIDILEDMLDAHTKPGEDRPNVTFMLLGNSIRLDMNFIEKFFPAFYSRLHYRMLDVSAVAQFAQDFFGIVSPRKKHLHTAAEDIAESIDQLRFIRSAFLGKQCPDALAHYVALDA